MLIIRVVSLWIRCGFETERRVNQISKGGNGKVKWVTCIWKVDHLAIVWESSERNKRGGPLAGAGVSAKVAHT